MGTDIDRLHKVVLGELRGRGCGKTVALCHCIAGAIESGETEVDVVVPQHRWMGDTKSVLWDILDEHELDPRSTWSPRVWRTRYGAKINFLVSGERELLGRQGLFINMDDRNGIWPDSHPLHFIQEA